jgi:hypothetical protein
MWELISWCVQVALRHSHAKSLMQPTKAKRAMKSLCALITLRNHVKLAGDGRNGITVRSVSNAFKHAHVLRVEDNSRSEETVRVTVIFAGVR